MASKTWTSGTTIDSAWLQDVDNIAYTFHSARKFNVKGDGVTDDTVALQNLINYAIANNVKEYLPEGTFIISAPLTGTTTGKGLELEGAGANKTVFKYTSLTSQTCLTLEGGSGTVSQATISGISFIGSSTSIAIELRGVCGQKIKDCLFDTNSVGVLFHNYASGEFTEYCTADACQFSSTCTTWVEYRKTNGDRSFHGSGLINRCLGNTASSGNPSLILVGANCIPYNSPLDVQVWVNTPSVLIKNNNTGSPAIHNCNWSGKITVEPFGSNILTLASGYGRTFFSGAIHSINEYISFGVLQWVRGVESRADGSFGCVLEQKELTFTGVYSGLTLDVGSAYWPIGTSGSVLMHVTLTGTNYRYTHLLVATLASGAGGSNTVTKIADTVVFNSAGWGASTFSMDSSGNLIITNAGSGFNVTANVGISQIGWRQ